MNALLDSPADFRAGQGAPTRGYLKGTGEEAQRRPARKGAAQRVRYLWDRTLRLAIYWEPDAHKTGDAGKRNANFVPTLLRVPPVSTFGSCRSPFTVSEELYNLRTYLIQ